MSAYILLIFGFNSPLPFAVDVQTVHQCEAVYKQIYQVAGLGNVEHACIKRQQLPLGHENTHRH